MTTDDVEDVIGQIRATPDALRAILEMVKGCQLERVGPAMRRALVQMTDG